MRVVLDTNTLLSAIGWTGPPAQILSALMDGRHDIIVSPDLLDELIRVLRYPKLRAVAFHPSLPLVLGWLHQPPHVVIPHESIHAILSDPADNLVLEAAVAGTAEAIVSGDRHLLGLRSFRGIAIYTPRAFVTKHL